MAWNRFHKDDEEFATCIVGGCKAKIKHSRNTSKAGELVSERRNRLKPKNID